METGYQEFRRKEVVNLCDGKRLGKVCDVVFTYPEGKVQGFVVPGGKGCFRWGRADMFIDIRSISKIGVDVILVEVRTAPKAEKKRRGEPCYVGRDDPPPPPPPKAETRRDYEEYE